MKSTRGILIWATLALCGVMVLGAMSWLTSGVLASQRERAGAEARADLEECTRLALWRMDAAGAAIVSAENGHPFADYRPGSGVFEADRDPLVKLRFEVGESGGMTSPQGDADLDGLKKVLGEAPLPGDEWSLLIRAARAGERAWGSIPKDATNQRKNPNRSENRASQGYQESFNGAEKAQRAKTVEETVLSNSSWSPPPTKARSLKAALPTAPAASADAMAGVGKGAETRDLETAESPEIPLAEMSTMRATWIGTDLFLLRQASVESGTGLEKRIQGVWLDAGVLKQRLLGEARDLLPNADLTILKGGAEDSLALVSFPFLLHRNESPVAAGGGINGPLLVGWVAVLLALLTASLLVHGIMRLSERRASFVSAVTHELRTPLTTFRLYSDMLETGAVRPEKRGDYLRVLSREADRLSHLVENVLSFSRIERGSARSVVRESSVAALLEPMRERLEARLTTAGLALEMDLETAVAERHVRVDSASVEHILFNLIDNAAKYAATSDPATVSIAIQARPGAVEISVSDHGPGIPPKERRRIFRAFHKSAREAAESRPGVGLGLALSRRLANALGGSLECVDSTGGACFVLRLPSA